jgi:Tfp pilus assembly protein PilF
MSSLRRRFRLLEGVLTASLAISAAACSSSQTPTGDPTRMSESEADVAVDLWQVRNQPREALEHALRAADLDPENADASHLVALIYLDFCGRSALDECHLDEAEKFARRAVATRDSFLEAQNTLAVVLVHQKREAEAIQVLKPITANILYRTPEIAWGNLGWAYLEQGKNQEAVTALRRAVAAQPLFCVGNYRLGVAYHRTGHLTEAREALDGAVETDAPGCAQIQDAYLERALVNLALGDVERTRADLDRCIGLDKRTGSGRECGRLLTKLQ